MNSTPTGRRETIDGLDSIAFDRTFRAGIEDVWAAVTESDRLARWIGAWTGDPASGAVDFRMLFEGDEHQAEVLTIRECGPAPSGPRIARPRPGPQLAHDPDTRGTRRHHQAHLQPVRGRRPCDGGWSGPGWDYYLDRLVAAETGGDPAEVDFGDYHPVHEKHYLEMFT
ncbi:polyketide cyclase [Streptomyces zhihengii]